MRSNWRSVKELLLRQVVTRAWILLWCILALHWTKDVNFMFFSSNVSSSIFASTNNGVSYLALINGFGQLKVRCSWDIRDSPLSAICQDLKFGQIITKLLAENLFDLLLTMHECVKIGVSLKNYSWGQMVTKAWNFLWCILPFHWTKNINFTVWGAKSALQLRYTWFPPMSDLLRFEIWQVFLLENLCDVSLRMHECVQIGVWLNNYWWGQMVTRAWILLYCILALHWTTDINFMFFFLKFWFFYFEVEEECGLISCTHQWVWAAKIALQLRYTWFPAMSD